MEAHPPWRVGDPPRPVCNHFHDGSSYFHCLALKSACWSQYCRHHCTFKAIIGEKLTQMLPYFSARKYEMVAHWPWRPAPRLWRAGLPARWAHPLNQAQQPSLPPSLCTPAVFLGLINTCCNRNGLIYVNVDSLNLGFPYF